MLAHCFCADDLALPNAQRAPGCAEPNARWAVLNTAALVQHPIHIEVTLTKQVTNVGCALAMPLAIKPTITWIDGQCRQAKRCNIADRALRCANVHVSARDSLPLCQLWQVAHETIEIARILPDDVL